MCVSLVDKLSMRPCGIIRPLFTIRQRQREVRRQRRGWRLCETIFKQWNPKSRFASSELVFAKVFRVQNLWHSRAHILHEMQFAVRLRTFRLLVVRSKSSKEFHFRAHGLISYSGHGAGDKPKNRMRKFTIGKLHRRHCDIVQCSPIKWPSLNWMNTTPSISGHASCMRVSSFTSNDQNLCVIQIPIIFGRPYTFGITDDSSQWTFVCFVIISIILRYDSRYPLPIVGFCVADIHFVVVIVDESSKVVDCHAPSIFCETTYGDIKPTNGTEQNWIRFIYEMNRDLVWMSLSLFVFVSILCHSKAYHMPNTTNAAICLVSI